MIELLNVLYVVSQGAYLHLEHDTVRVEVGGETKARLPLLRLSGIAVFGRVGLSSALIARCAREGRSLVWLDRRGRFLARVEGTTQGNVLLRRAQHLALSDRVHATRIAKQMVAGKIQNMRQVLLRSAREAREGSDGVALSRAAERLADILVRLRSTEDLDAVRGAEGEAARVYFEAFGRTLRKGRTEFTPEGRTKRPPRDRTNAILSFLYTLLRTECLAALESVGLDPQVGYLHALRPGRPSLALDLMEELRPVLADRLAITLINRGQLRDVDFEDVPGGAVYLGEDGRRTVIAAYQQRKEKELTHRVLNRRVPLGLVPHLQARLLARHLRGDLDDYPPYLYR